MIIVFLSSDNLPWIGRKFFSYISSLISLAGCFKYIWKSVLRCACALSVCAMPAQAIAIRKNEIEKKRISISLCFKKTNIRKIIEIELSFRLMNDCKFLIHSLILFTYLQDVNAVAVF